MNMKSQFSVDALVADLAPVRPVTPGPAWFAVAGATAIAIILIAARYGLRSDVVAGTPDPIVLLRAGTLLLLGIAATTAVVTAARPGVGRSSHGWQWALAAAGLFPVTSVALAAMNGGFPTAVLTAQSGPYCLGLSSGGALMIGGLLAAWLRRGAPTAINRVSWLTGLAAGSFGTFAYSLHCPSDTVHYIGLWYTLAIGMCAGFARLVVPRVIRW
jgi:hypothetical protein